jgi:hypothetical protein
MAWVLNWASSGGATGAPRPSAPPSIAGIKPHCGELAVWAKTCLPHCSHGTVHSITSSAMASSVGGTVSSLS